jgi:cyclic pyranopterin phosphate synthase
MALIDPFGRTIDYIRLSVTDRCDLRCHYCLPPRFKDFEVPEQWLSFEEIERVIAAFARLGTRRVRITGGEPLLRRDLPNLIKTLERLDNIDDLSLSTNAIRLQKLAQPLYKAGIRRINVSLDSLDPQRYSLMTGGGKLQKVLTGLEAAKTAGFSPIKINMVVLNGQNLHEVENILNYCLENNFTLRLIEPMPVGEPGRKANKNWVNLTEIQSRLAQDFDLIPALMKHGGPARYMRVAGTDVHIGFITPLSRHFCETCNRVRLAVDGTLYMCLGQNDKMELRPLLRAGANNSDLDQAIINAIARKPERHNFLEQPNQIVRFMARTGG